jgi:hypothetical protein
MWTATTSWCPSCATSRTAACWGSRSNAVEPLASRQYARSDLAAISTYAGQLERARSYAERGELCSFVNVSPQGDGRVKIELVERALTDHGVETEILASRSFDAQADDAVSKRPLGRGATRTCLGAQRSRPPRHSVHVPSSSRRGPAVERARPGPPTCRVDRARRTALNGLVQVVRTRPVDRVVRHRTTRAVGPGSCGSRPRSAARSSSPGNVGSCLANPIRKRPRASWRRAGDRRCRCRLASHQRR